MLLWLFSISYDMIALPFDSILLFAEGWQERRRTSFRKAPKTLASGKPCWRGRACSCLTSTPAGPGPPPPSTSSSTSSTSSFRCSCCQTKYCYHFSRRRWRQGGRWSSCRWTATQCPSLRCLRASATQSLSWSLRARKLIFKWNHISD